MTASSAADRAGAAIRLLDALLDGDLAAETARAEAAFAATNDAYHLALAAIARFWAHDYEGARQTAKRAGAAPAECEAGPGHPDPAPAVDPDPALDPALDLRLMVAAAQGFARAGLRHDPATGTLDADPLDTLARLAVEVAVEVEVERSGPRMPETARSSDLRMLALYFAAEAALACARLELAERFIEAAGAVRDGFHAFSTVLWVARARVLAFQGRITEALAVLESAPAPAHPLAATLLEATLCLVRGNAADARRVRELAGRLESRIGRPDDYGRSGCYLLASYGLIAVGEVRWAARLVLQAGGDAGLNSLVVIDRALGLELLVSAAAADDDLDAAEAWAAQASVLAGDPIARPAIERLFSRLALLRGEAELAVRWAQAAVEHSAADGRVIEHAEGGIVLARAQIALGTRVGVSERLETMRADADPGGYLAVGRAAARELRTMGRRLRPVAGSGFAALSAREREVALLAAEGAGNQRIADTLHLSSRTVQAHLSRVLAAFGVPTRSALAGALAADPPPDAQAARHPHPDAVARSALTARQREVAERIADGLTNERIAAELGVGAKTIEKHVAEILHRWNVSSRVEVARLVRTAESPH